MNAWFESIAVFTSCCYVGAICYQLICENVGRSACDIKNAVAQWNKSFKNQQWYLMIFLLPSITFSIARYGVGGSYFWLIGGLLILLIPIYTVIGLFPIYKKVIEFNNEPFDNENLDKNKTIMKTIDLIGYLHIPKAFLTFAASALFLSVFNKP